MPSTEVVLEYNSPVYCRACKQYLHVKDFKTYAGAVHFENSLCVNAKKVFIVPAGMPLEESNAAH